MEETDENYGASGGGNEMTDNPKQGECNEAPDAAKEAQYEKDVKEHFDKMLHHQVIESLATGIRRAEVIIRSGPQDDARKRGWLSAMVIRQAKLWSYYHQKVNDKPPLDAKDILLLVARGGRSKAWFEDDEGDDDD